MDYEKFSDEVENAANYIQLKKSIASERKGAAKARDKLVTGKLAWQEALSFVTIIQSAIIFTALIPNSVDTVNGFMAYLGIPFKFPVTMASVGAMVFVLVVFLFGLIALRHWGTMKRTQEIATKMNPATYLLWEKLEKLEKKIEEKDGKD